MGDAPGIIKKAEDSPVNELPEHDRPKASGKSLVNAGAVIAVLLGIPCFFIGVYGVVGVLTGQKIVGGLLGAAWGYLAVAGMYELNRRKFDWARGKKFSDLHLLGGTVAVATGLIISGALHETMPALGIVPALSALTQASDGHGNKFPSLVHLLVLATGAVIGIWFYTDGVVGAVLLDRVAALP